MVAAIDALRRSEATGESISAKISVHKYIAIRIKTPSSAETRFSFFHVTSPFIRQYSNSNSIYQIIEIGRASCRERV